MKKINDDTLTHFLSIPPNNRSIEEFVCCFSQIARIFEILGTNLKFNHRDFKTENIMYKYVEKKNFISLFMMLILKLNHFT